MSIIKRAADFAYAVRFVKLLTTPWENTDAFKLGLVDKEGKRDKSVKLDNDEKKSAYTLFIRFVYNIKRLVQKAPGGGTVVGSLAAGLLLLKENYGISENNMKKILEKLNIDTLDFMLEKTEWFVTQDKMLSPGVYSLRNEKIINSSGEEVVNINDKIRVNENCYPKGDIFGLDVYEATHINTNQKVYVTLRELNR